MQIERYVSYWNRTCNNCVIYAFTDLLLKIPTEYGRNRLNPFLHNKNLYITTDNKCVKTTHTFNIQLGTMKNESIKLYIYLYVCK